MTRVCCLVKNLNKLRLAIAASFLSIQVDAQCSITTATVTDDASAVETITITSVADVIFTHDNTACSTCAPTVTISIDSYGSVADMLVNSGISDNAWNVMLNAPIPEPTEPAGGSSANTGGALMFSAAAVSAPGTGYTCTCSNEEWVDSNGVCIEFNVECSGCQVTEIDGYIVYTYYDTGTYSFEVAGSGEAEYLVVGGGGGGGSDMGGGGGAGGYVTGTATITAGTYEIVVGTGGGGAAAGCSSSTYGTNGGDSYISGPAFTYRGLGGGRAGSSHQYSGTISNGASGGSGGGGSAYCKYITLVYKL